MPMKLNFAAAALTAGMMTGLATVPAHATQVVLDFEQFAHSGTGLGVGNIIHEDGFTLSATPSRIFQALGSAFPYFNGSTTLVLGNIDPANPTMTLTKDGGGAFSLESVDLSRLISGTPTVTFNGQTESGVITQSFTLADIDAPQTFIFGAQFGNVLAVSFDENEDVIGEIFYFDNFVLNDPVAVTGGTSVPGPGMAIPAALAAAGLLAARRPSYS